MDQQSLESNLADLQLSAIRFYQSIGSTNDEAGNWIEVGAPDLSLVIADEQTAGRGRSNRRWISAPGASLTFSLILRSPPFNAQFLSRLPGLGAVAVQNALHKKFSIPAQIKWPNDILIDQMKVCGVLVEVRWHGESPEGIIIGIGINIAPESISSINLPTAGLNFPVTCIESVLGHPVDRLELLHAILQEILFWLPRLSSPEFILAWESTLAFLGQWVEIFTGETSAHSIHGNVPPDPKVGKVIGLSQDGSLRLSTPTGEFVTVSIGEVHLRPGGVGQPFQALD